MRTVLLIEDGPHLRRILTDYLESQGFPTVAVDSHDDAIHELDRGCFDFVMMDYVTWGSLGPLEFIKYVRNKSPWPDIPIILTTAFRDMDISVDVQAILYKPFDLCQIMKVFRTLGRRKESASPLGNRYDTSRS